MKRSSLHFLLALAVLLSLAALVAGCGSSGGSGGGQSTGGTPKSGGTLHFGFEEEPTSLDPESAFLQTEAFVDPQINEGLVQFAADNKVEPRLATSWKQSKDGLVWTFQLRKGVTFSDGSPFTAEDVAFTINRLRNGAVFSPAYAPLTNVKATSPTTVVFETSKPYPALLAYLGWPPAGIVPNNYGGVSEKRFSQRPIGTGPFTLKSWHHGQSLILAKNPNYWQPKQPRLNEIVITTTTNETARLSQMRAGDLDMTTVSPLGIKAGLAQDSEISYHESVPSVVSYLILNSNWSPLEDARMREAVNLSIDREGIIEAASDGKGTIGTSFMVPSYSPYHDSELQPPDRNVAKAKRLVAEAVDDGVSPGFTLKVAPFSEFFTIAAQIIQQDLEEVGIHVKLEKLESATLYEEISTGKGSPAALERSAAWTTDPSELTLSFPVFGEHTGADVKRLNRIAEAAKEADAGKRKQLYFDWQRTLADEEEVIPLAYEPLIFATRNLAGIEYTPTGLPTFAAAGFTN